MKITYNEYLKQLGILEKAKQDYENLIGNLGKKHKVYQEHDKIFKKVLSNKKEFTHFVNTNIKMAEQINEEQIEKYEKNFLTESFEVREADIVYKIKDKNVFFLIEHQSRIDYSMPYRILNYQMQILKSSINMDNIKKKDYVMPLIIGVVIYTGKSKWNVKKKFSEITEKIKSDNNKYLQGIDTIYKLVDINDFSKDELLKSNFMLDKIMLIEKAKDKKELVENLELAVYKMKKEEAQGLITQEEIKEMEIFIKLIFSQKIKNQEVNKLLEKLKEGEEDMGLAVIDMMDEEFAKCRTAGRKAGIREGRKEGRIEGKMQVAKKLFEINMSFDEVKRITGLEDKMLKEIQ